MKLSLTSPCLVLGLLMGLGTAPELLAKRALSEWLDKLHQEQMSFFEEMIERSNGFWQDVDKLLAGAHYSEKEKGGTVTVFDKDAVKLPEITIEKHEDSKNKASRELSLAIKNLDIPKDSLKVELDEDEGYAQLVIPYENSQVTLKIYPNGYTVSAEKKITQEKKDEKGNVLGSSSYTAYNSYTQSFPYSINVRALKPEFKEKILTLTFGKRDAKRAIPIK